MSPGFGGINFLILEIFKKIFLNLEIYSLQARKRQAAEAECPRGFHLGDAICFNIATRLTARATLQALRGLSHPCGCVICENCCPRMWRPCSSTCSSTCFKTPKRPIILLSRTGSCYVEISRRGFASQQVSVFALQMQR